MRWWFSAACSSSCGIIVLCWRYPQTETVWLSTAICIRMDSCTISIVNVKLHDEEDNSAACLKYNSPWVGSATLPCRRRAEGASRIDWDTNHFVHNNYKIRHFNFVHYKSFTTYRQYCVFGMLEPPHHRREIKKNHFPALEASPLYVRGTTLTFCIQYNESLLFKVLP